MLSNAPLSPPSSQGQHLAAADRFQLVVEAIGDYAIYMLDPEGNIETWSSGAERIKGYRAEEVVGKHYSMFFRAEDRHEGLPMWQLERAKLHGKTEDEGWRVRKDGSTFWAHILISVIRDVDGALIGYAKITRDITEHRRLREMEPSLRRMNEFLAMLGHELRNPLAPMRYALDLMQTPGASESAQTASCEVLDRQLTRLTHLLDGLLDAGRLTSGKLQISPKRIDFKPVVAHAVESVGPALLKQSQVLQIVMPTGEITVNADEMRITQVLQNLLSNASKFTSAGGHIELSVYIEADRLFVSVADDGVGMDPATIDDLFHLFVQGENQQSGLGIGLALSRSIVEMHGGKISGTSAGKGLGSVFRFDLPGATYEDAPV
jgi:PAS domain S-box-containing protein